MKHLARTPEDLIEENASLKRRIQELEQSPSERKQSAPAQRQSGKLYGAIVQMAMDGFWMVDMQGRLLEVNDTYSRMSGYSTQELLAMGISDLVASETIDGIATFRQTITERREHPFEARHRRKDGTIFDVEASVRYLPIEGGRFVSFIRDITERKQAQEMLRLSEENFHRCIEDFPMGVRIVTKGDEVIYVNRAFLDLFGCGSFDEWRKIPPEQRYTPESYAEIQSRKEKRKQGNHSEAEYETSIIRKDGGIRRLKAYRRSVIWDGKEQFMFVYQDITKRQRTENETAALVEIGRVIGSTLDIDELYRRFDAEASKLIDYDRLYVSLMASPDTFVVAYFSGIDVPARRLGDVYPTTGSIAGAAMNIRSGLLIQPETSEEIHDLYPHLYETFKIGLRSSMVVPLIAMDKVIGSLGFLSRKLHAFTEGDLHLAERIGMQIAGAIANAKLFSDLSKAETDLRENEKRYQRIVETADEGIRERDDKNRTTFVNRKLSEMLGYSPEEIRDRPFTDFMFEEDHADHLERSRQLTNWQGDQHERRFRRKDGTTCWTLVSVTPIQNETGRVTGSFAMLTDITERKRADEELERYQRNLEQMVTERTAELEIRNMTLQELNAALKVLLKQREDDKKDMEERFVMNMQNLLLPFVEQMKKGHLDFGQQRLLDFIEEQIHEIATPLLKNVRQFNLTPRELKVAALVKSGKPTKEIAESLLISTGSVNVIRKNVRKKLGLKNRKANLQSYLDTLSQ